VKGKDGIIYLDAPLPASAKRHAGNNAAKATALEAASTDKI
jgi:hypothetical protein